MLTVLTVDLAKGLEPVDSVAVMTDGADRLRLAGEPLRGDRALGRPADARQADAGEGRRHDRDPQVRHLEPARRPQYRGSGEVSGYLLSQWSLSEYRGVLRVVSTESPAWWGPAGGETESFLTTLRQQGRALVAGRAGSAGSGRASASTRCASSATSATSSRSGRSTRSTRSTSPFPASPRVLGELKIPGYSAYLHPIGEDLLLGIGQDATEEGRPLGTQLSLFDVSDLRKPDPAAQPAARPGLVRGGVRPPRVPLLAEDRARRRPVRAASRRLSASAAARGIADRREDRPRGRQAHSTPPIRRSLVVRNAVLTVSDSGVKSSSLATLAELGWAAFPPPEQPGAKPVP